MLALARNIETARKRTGATQEELAKIAGVDPATVYRLEAGQGKRPGLAVVMAIQGALKALGSDVTLDELAGATVSKDDLSLNEMLMIATHYLNRIRDLQASQKVPGELHYDDVPRLPIDSILGASSGSSGIEVRIFDVSAAADAWRALHNDSEGDAMQAARFTLSDDHRTMLRNSLAPVIGLRVRGDCMLPVARDGQTVLVQPAASQHEHGVEWVDGDDVIATVDGDAHFKKARQRGDLWTLEPLNGGPIIVVDDDRTRVVAVVIGTVIWH